MASEQSIKKMYALQGAREYSRELWAFFDTFEEDETWTTEEIKNILIEEHDKYRAAQRQREEDTEPTGEDVDSTSE